MHDRCFYFMSSCISSRTCEIKYAVFIHNYRKTKDLTLSNTKEMRDCFVLNENCSSYNGFNIIHYEENEC
jgi:hypothetical protein